ncbi:unnamed protein product [Mortierella alpina]
MTRPLRVSMLPDALVEEALFSSASDRLEFQSNSLESDFYRNNALFPAEIFETNYGRTIRLLLDPQAQRAPLQWNQTSNFIQLPIVVMMMTRGRLNHVDQGPVPDSSSSSRQETGSSSQQGARSDLKKRSSKNRSSSSQAISLASSSVDCKRKPSKKRKTEERGHHHQGNETSKLVYISQPLGRDGSHSHSRMGDKGEKDESQEDDIPIKSGRWSAAEDAALFQGVHNHLASLGLEPQPPLSLPSEAELRERGGPAGGTLAMASPQGHRREHFTGATTEDSTFFDSIVNTSCYLEGVDSSHASSIETHPPVSISPPSGSSSKPRHGSAAAGSNILPTATETSTVVSNGPHSGLENFYGHPPHVKLDADTSALFEALSVAANHIRTSGKRNQSDIQQDDSGDSSGRDETTLEQQNGLDQGYPCFMGGDPQVHNVSLAAWPHSVQVPLSPGTLRRSVAASTLAWTYPGLPHTSDTQQDSHQHQLVSHPQLTPQSTSTYSQHSSVPSAIRFNCGLPLIQPSAAGSSQQQQCDSALHSDRVSAVDAYWYPPSAVSLDPIVHTDGSHSNTHLLDDRFNSISAGDNPMSHQSELDPLHYLNHYKDYSCCINLRDKPADRFKRTQYQVPDQHHPLVCPPYLNFTRSPSTRKSHSQSPVSFSLPPSSRNSPRLSSAVRSSAFAALDNTVACEGASIRLFEHSDPEPSPHSHGFVHSLSADPNLGLTHESDNSEMHSLPLTRESYALAISRAMTTCPWNKITRQSIPGRTGVQAQARWSEALDPQVKKGKWSAEEDALLLRGVQASHKCWIWIADGIPGRTQRQCRTRWVQISTRAEREAAAAAVALAKGQARGMCAL